MSAISIESFLPVAAHFRITPSYLYQQVSQAGESFHFDVSFISSIQTVIPAGLFYQHVDIQVRGQNTNHTHFTYCNISIDPTQLLGSFHVCVNTTVADTYDLILLYDGVPLLGMPCLGCIQIIPSQVAIANTVVTGLTDTLLAGTSLSFTIQLRDEYNNLVDPSSLFVIYFVPNEFLYITNDTSQISPHSYHFLLYLNHTEIYTFSIYVNDIPLPSPFTVCVVASQPSDLSSFTFISDIDFLVSMVPFEVHNLKLVHI